MSMLETAGKIAGAVAVVTGGVALYEFISGVCEEKFGGDARDGGRYVGKKRDKKKKKAKKSKDEDEDDDEE